ncbi:MAG: Gfo/Idh/MocA family oxidoreductase [Phycisphaerales bacterium]|nr:MAG: Gfo/Idh/MocA family oxidoreductase [Phycisphaerales bacterium]
MRVGPKKGFECIDVSGAKQVERLRAALIGLAGVGEDYLAAIRSSNQFDLVAVADSRSEVLRKHDEDELRTYEDYRSLIVEGVRAGLDLLFVALEPFQAIEFVELAAGEGVAVFHKTPFARHVEEGKKLLIQFDEKGLPFLVARYWQVEPAFADLANLAKSAGRIHTAAANVRTTDGSDGWRGDAARAGGGVLLNGAYEQVDMLVSLLGLPESVYAQCSAATAPGSPRNYDTEDGALMMLRFSGDRFASVTAWRGEPEPCWHVALVGDKCSVDVYPDCLTKSHRDGREEENHAVQEVNRASVAISAVEAAYLSVVQPARPTAREHLSTLAVIEAAYLSAKTAAPESPSQFLA